MGIIDFKCCFGSKIVKVFEGSVEIAIVMVVGIVEDEKTLSIVSFMKSKLYNCLTTHLDLVVHKSFIRRRLPLTT